MNFVDNVNVVINRLQELSHSFSFASDLIEGENLQPTTTGRYFLRSAGLCQESAIQKTVEDSFGAYAWMSDAYCEKGFEFVVDHFGSEIKKAEDAFQHAINLFSELDEEKKWSVAKVAIETYTCIAKARIGLYNWQLTLSKRFEGDSLGLRVKKINTLILSQSEVLGSIFKKCVHIFPNMNELIDESYTKECKTVFVEEKCKTTEDNIKIICDFPSENAPILKAYSGRLIEVFENKLLPSEWVKTFSHQLDEVMETALLLMDIVEQHNKKSNELFNVDESKLNDSKYLGLLKDRFQEELSLLMGLETINEDFRLRYSSREQHKEALVLLGVAFKLYENTVKQHGDQFLSIVKGLEETLKLNQSMLNPIATNKIDAKDAKERLDAYVPHWSPNISLEQARCLIDEGKKLYSQILNGTIKAPQEYIGGDDGALTALSWFLMRMALDKKQGHVEGAFSVEDKDDCLYKFFLNAKACHDRPSSHYVGRSSLWMRGASHHKGIDVLNGQLPTGKRHILFGKALAPAFTHKPEAENILFIKLEEYSPFVTTGFGYDMVMHGAEFCIAQFNKIFYPGSDDLPEMAKERVPAALIKMFNTLVDQCKDIDHFEIKKQAKLWGISYMHFFAKELIDSEAFIKELKEYDHVEKRTGREVYLTHEEVLGKI